MKGRHIFFAITAILLPFILLMNSVMLVFTPAYLQHEYKSPSFPPDPFGFTLEQRIEYGTKSVNYIIGTQEKYPDDYLGELQFEDGTPLYNERELSHMKDVRDVFRTTRGVMAAAIVFVIITIWLVSKKQDSLQGFFRALSTGSLITLGLILMVIIAILTGFDAFFEAFHHLFFTGDSWLFYENDSLIRLFPEPLWVHGFTLTAILTAVFAAAILIVSQVLGKKVSRNRVSGKQRKR